MAVKLCHSHILHKLRIFSLQSFSIKRSTATTSTTRSAEAVFVGNSIEVPIIAITDRDNVDLIGPPDPISNLRPVVRKRHPGDTELQHTLRNMQDATHEWNQHFWAEHNTRFIKQRKEFVKLKQQGKDITENLSAEEMSEFYKKFLDDNWSTHIQYNLAWYKKNFHILFLSLRATLPPSLHFMGNSTARY